MIILCSCSSSKESEKPTDASDGENPPPTSQNQNEIKGRLSNPYAKDETVEIHTEERSWYNIVRDTTTTYGAAQLKLSIVEDIFSMRSTVTTAEGKEQDDYCVMIGVCIKAVSIPDDVDYITFPNYIREFQFLTSDKSEGSPIVDWGSSLRSAYTAMYNEAKNSGHINYNYYINIDYREQKLYEGGKLYFLLGGLCLTDFGVSSPDELDFLGITYYDKDSNPVTVYISIK